MLERFFLGVVGLVFGLGTFALVGLTTFLVITEAPQRIAHHPVQAPNSYAQLQSDSAAR